MQIRMRLLHSVGKKIIAICIGLSAVSIIAVTAVAITVASESLEREAFNKLRAVHEIKRSRLVGYLGKRFAEVRVMAYGATTRMTLRRLLSFLDEAGVARASSFSLRDGRYQAAYAYAHRYMDGFRSIWGYEDIILVSYAHGMVVYSSKKNSDLGTSLASGRFRDSDLARLWRKCRDAGEPMLIDMHAYEAAGGIPAMLIGCPLIDDNGVRLGVLMVQISLKEINGIFHERAGMGDTGELYAVGSDRRMRSDSFLDPNGHSVNASFKGTIEKNGVDTVASRESLAERSGAGIINDYRGVPVLSVYGHAGINDNLNADFDWAVIAEIDREEVYAPINRLAWYIVAIAGCILAFAVIVAVLFGRRISRPLVAMVDSAKRIAAGDLTAETIRITSTDELSLLGDAFSQMTSSLNRVLGRVNQVVEQASSRAGQASASSQSLSQGATLQASSLQQVSSSLGEIHAQTRKNAENASAATAIARQSMENAERGNEKIKDLVVAMEQINISSEDIQKVVTVIDDIAFQINLLALNANVEAARAGKFGKGFAVVADEVRGLAGRSAESVRETNLMVEESIRNVESGNRLVEETARQFQEIVSGASQLAKLVEDIAVASREQAQALDQINRGLMQIDQVTQANTASAEESASASEDLAAQAAELRSMIARFTLK